MKTYLKSVFLVASAAVLTVPGQALAEATYGYNAAGAGVLSATARLGVTVNVPKLLLLRVGSTGATVDMATINATLSIPGGPAVPVDGPSLATSWDGTAPVWTGGSSAAFRAYAWTNSSGGGSIASNVTTDFPADAALKGKVAVASTTVSGAGLTHPAFMSTAGPMTFVKNVVASSDWVFSISALNLGTTNAGAHVAEMTYTATTP